MSYFERLNNDPENLDTVISGSFRKHMEQIGGTLDSFRKAGVNTLAPETHETTDSRAEFIVLATDDPTKLPNQLEKDFMREIAKATFLYVANVEGYIGKSAAAEMAYARIKGTPIVMAEPVMLFSQEIPVPAQQLLKNSAVDVLAISDINLENVQLLKDKLGVFSQDDLSKEDQQILSSLVRALIKDLSS